MNELRRPAIIFGQPCFNDDEVNAAAEVIRSSWIGQGPKVLEFEAAFASYVHARHAVAVSSCTAALHLALLAAGVQPGDEIITTPFTFIATLNAILYCRATPILVDIDPRTLNVTPAAVAAAITERTRAVLPVHFGGLPVDVSGFQNLVDQHDMWLIEDCAHAVGAIVNSEFVGSCSHPRQMSCFSFYPNKNVATAEGGVVTLQDEARAARIASLRLHGLDNDAWARYSTSALRPSLATDLGFKYNMTDLQAAIALVQLCKLEGFLATREFLAAKYDEALAAVEQVTPVQRPRSSYRFRHALHLYQVWLQRGIDRNAVVRRLRERGIGVAVHYIGVNLHPFFRAQFADLELRSSDDASRRLISLPLHPGMSELDVERVAAELIAATRQATH